MHTENRSVVVTGASSGIGEATARHLDGLGFRVFAGVRRDADGEALARRASERLTPIRLDVTVGPGARKMKNLARLPVGLRDWLLAKKLYPRRTV